jgi:hypothetical protein
MRGDAVCTPLPNSGISTCPLRFVIVSVPLLDTRPDVCTHAGRRLDQDLVAVADQLDLGEPVDVDPRESARRPDFATVGPPESSAGAGRKTTRCRKSHARTVATMMQATTRTGRADGA